MTTIPASVAFAEWQKDPAYRAAYQALAPEYELAATLIAARARAGTRTLERIATATGSRLRVVLEGG